MSESLERAKRAYEKKRRIKTVSFNLETEGELFEFAESLSDFSRWLKGQIQNEIDKKKTAQ